MKLLLALGNPGPRYTTTRHNAGFIILDAYAAEQGVQFAPKSRFNAELAEFSHGGEKVILAKPTTFYNETGVAARAVMDFYKLPLDDVLVIHDDVALDFGKIRVRRGGESAGNNGLKSLHQHIGQNFWHIRLGTDNKMRQQVGDVDFVLSNFTSDEQAILQQWAAEQSASLIAQFLAGDIAATSVTYQPSV
jgi:aminoacyl-tRNA hydrolase